MTKDDLVLSLQKEAEKEVRSNTQTRQLKTVLTFILGLFVFSTLMICFFAPSPQSLHLFFLTVRAAISLSLFTICVRLMGWWPVGKISAEEVEKRFYEISNIKSLECIERVKAYLNLPIQTQSIEELEKLQIENQLFRDILNDNLEKAKKNPKYQ